MSMMSSTVVCEDIDFMERENVNIHSGQFMVSQLDDEDTQDADSDVPVVKPKHESRNSKTYVYGQHRHRVVIDASLTKLFECMTLAYSGKITSPRWKPLKGTTLTIKDKVRLNNIIWREWTMQYIYLRRSIICQFASPLNEDVHTKPEAVVLEGKYWKRKLDTVTAEYKKCRKYFKQLACRRGLCIEDLSVTELLDRVGEVISSIPPGQQMSPDMYLGFCDDDFKMDFTDSLFTTINAPFAFPTPKELYRIGYRNIIQPGLQQLQPNIDVMDTFDPFQEMMILQRINEEQESELTICSDDMEMSGQGESLLDLIRQSSPSATERPSPLLSPSQPSPLLSQQPLPMSSHHMQQPPSQQQLPMSSHQHMQQPPSQQQLPMSSHQHMQQPPSPMPPHQHMQQPPSPMPPQPHIQQAMTPQPHIQQSITPQPGAMLSQPLINQLPQQPTNLLAQQSPLNPQQPGSILPQLPASMLSQPTTLMIQQPVEILPSPSPLLPQQTPTILPQQHLLSQQPPLPQLSPLSASLITQHLAQRQLVQEHLASQQQQHLSQPLQSPILPPQPQFPQPTIPQQPVRRTLLQQKLPPPPSLTQYHPQQLLQQQQQPQQQPSIHQLPTPQPPSLIQQPTQQSILRPSTISRPPTSQDQSVSMEHLLQNALKKICAEQSDLNQTNLAKTIANFKPPIYPAKSPLVTPNVPRLHPVVDLTVDDTQAIKQESILTKLIAEPLEQSAGTVKSVQTVPKEYSAFVIPKKPIGIQRMKQRPIAPATPPSTTPNTMSLAQLLTTGKYMDSKDEVGLDQSHLPAIRPTPSGDTPTPSQMILSIPQPSKTMSPTAIKLSSTLASAMPAHIPIRTRRLSDNTTTPSPRGDRGRKWSGDGLTVVKSAGVVPFDVKPLVSQPMSGVTVTTSLPGNVFEVSSVTPTTTPSTPTPSPFTDDALMLHGDGGFNDPRKAIHITAEKKRRVNIKSGFDMLHVLVPSLRQQPHAKVSKATMLHKTADFCRKLKQERSQCQKEVVMLKQEIEGLNASIVQCQSQLPETGVPVTRQRVDKMKDMFDSYVRTRTLDNWKFWIFSIFISKLFDSFNNMVSTANNEEMYRTVVGWLDQHCTLLQLRPLVLTSLRTLSTSTSILSDPEAVQQHALRTVNKHRPSKQGPKS